MSDDSTTDKAAQELAASLDPDDATVVPDDPNVDDTPDDDHEDADSAADDADDKPAPIVHNVGDGTFAPINE